MVDHAFLRRRVPPRPVAPSLATAPAPEVDPGPPPTSAKPSRGPLRTPRTSPRTQLFSAPVPVPGRTSELDAESPVARLDFLRSSIGSLLVDGAAEVVWESVDGVSGSETPSGDVVGTVVPTAGNRPLVGFDGHLAVVALRHVRELRRALFVGAPGGSLGVRLFDGSTITGTGPGPGAVVILVLVIDGLVELRVASARAGASAADVHREFGFEVTPRFDFHDGNG